ncbi:unnamed protein product [Rotaria sp. Silwood2]|nr:unnamed protein product [Rotaria sp. Silwood2]CAF3094418.1 unnamed protein product [Rotaria sp. Silwood2]
MPRISKRKSRLKAARACRESNVHMSDSSDLSSDEYGMDIDDDEELRFKDKLPPTDIDDLTEMCLSKCDTKYLSTLLYMSLRFFDVKWEDIDEYLKSIGLMTVETSHKWATVFINGDYEEFSNDLRGGIGAQCPTDKIEYVDENGVRQVIDCYFKQGPHKGKSEGLVEICKDLGAKLSDKVTLAEIHEKLAKHLAFRDVTKLEMLPSKYDMKIIYCPKYHCELNATEGLWCNQKAFVRSRTDQSFDKMIRLIADSRTHLVERNIALKLFRRFWRSIEAYSQGQTYADVLQLFFSQLCKTSVQSHRRISNTNINQS